MSLNRLKTHFSNETPKETKFNEKIMGIVGVSASEVTYIKHQAIKKSSNRIFKNIDF